MKSKVILANSNDPKYKDLKKIVDNVEIWQTLDFECVTASKDKMKKIKFNELYYILSFSTTTYENKTFSYGSLELNNEEIITQLIKRYEGGKIFVWAKNLEKKIFKILIKNCKDKNRKNILRIMFYNIIDLQSLFEGVDPLIMINNQIKSAALENWSDFFEFQKTPINAKDISFIGYSLLEKKIVRNHSKDRTNKNFIEKVIRHNELDTKTIYEIFIMIKKDKKRMIFLNELDNQSLEI